MAEGRLKELLYKKIDLEMISFRKKLMLHGVEKVYDSAYQIECMKAIYDILIQMMDEIDKGVLEQLLVVPGLLSFLYQIWLKDEDSFQKEMQEHIRNELEKFQKEEAA